MSEHLDYELPEGLELCQDGPFLRFLFRDETLRNIIRAFTGVTDADGQPRDDGRIWFWKYDFEHWSRVWGDEWDYVVRLQNAARERLTAGKRGEWAMTRSDLAGLLGVSLGTVDRLINNLKPVEEGGRTGFKWSSLRCVVRFYKDGRPENGKTGRRGHVPYTVAVAFEPLPHSKHWGELARVYQSIGGQMELLLPASENSWKSSQNEGFSSASVEEPGKALTLRTEKSSQNEDFSEPQPGKSPHSESFFGTRSDEHPRKSPQTESFSSHARASGHGHGLKELETLMAMAMAMADPSEKLPPGADPEPVAALYALLQLDIGDPERLIPLILNHPSGKGPHWALCWCEWIAHCWPRFDDPTAIVINQVHRACDGIDAAQDPPREWKRWVAEQSRREKSVERTAAIVAPRQLPSPAPPELQTYWRRFLGCVHRADSTLRRAVEHHVRRVSRDEDGLVVFCAGEIPRLLSSEAEQLARLARQANPDLPGLRIASEASATGGAP